MTRTATHRPAVVALGAAEPVTAALMDVLDLHVAWGRREQVFGAGGYSRDKVSGIGCRSCDWSPSLRHVTVELSHCMTMEALRRRLTPEAGRG